jgi:hypothetical protein
MLPPIVYVPQAKPKKVETRKSRIQPRAAGSIEDADDVEETYRSIGPGQAIAAGNRLPPDTFAAIEGSERKPPSTTGLLSEGTLKAMLQAQELE